MADKTGIEWTDATWNPTVGCSIVSPGCTNCYAMKQAAALERRFGSAKYAGLTQSSKAGPVWNGVVRLDEGALDQPLRWRRPRRIFVNSMSDLFHDALPDEAIDRVFAVMALAPQHTFQVLTKRADRMRNYFSGTQADVERWHAWRICQAIDQAVPWRTPASNDARQRVASDRPLPNVWLGVSVEDQPRADERIPLLLETPAAVRFLSCEPLLGPLDLTPWLWRPAAPSEMPGHALNDAPGADYVTARGTLHQVITGGESGPGARPMHPAWARSLRDQCQAAGVPFFFKQWGEFHADGQAWPDGTYGFPESDEPLVLTRVGKKAAGRLLDGRTWDEMPR